MYQNREDSLRQGRNPDKSDLFSIDHCLLKPVSLTITVSGISNRRDPSIKSGAGGSCSDLLRSMKFVPERIVNPISGRHLLLKK